MATKQEQEARIRLGSQIVTLSDEYDHEEIGKVIHGLIAAVVKAALPGRQSQANTKRIQQEAQKAFARKLSRKVAAL